MKLRFNIHDAQYSAGTLCNPTAQSNYTNLSGTITINGVNTITFTNLASGLFLHLPLPFVSGNVTIQSVTLVNSFYVTLQLDVANISEQIDVKITLAKTGFKPVNRSFTTFGYDIGKNPNVALTAINPDLKLVMIPTTYPSVAATTGVRNPTIGQQFTITANNLGTVGNGISFVGVGPGTTINALVIAWNGANPLNTVTLTYTLGAGYEPFLGETFTLSGGANASTDSLTYANFSGWRKPFTNDLLLFANYSNLNDEVAYKNIDPLILAETHIAYLPCYAGTAIQLISLLYAPCNCGCGAPDLIDSCTYGDIEIPGLILIPTFSCGVTCASCCVDDCLVLDNDNFAQFVLDTGNITPLNVNDISVISVEEVTIQADVYSACGNYLNGDSTVISLNPLPALAGSQIPITFPEVGDYIVKCTVSSYAFVCTKVESFKGCTYYKVDKQECNKHLITNLSLSSISIQVDVLNKDLQWVEKIPVLNVDPCTSYTVELPEDGVYRILIEGTDSYIIVQDCAMKACFFDYSKNRLCTSKASCACGGNCNGMCKNIPLDVYDFSVFSMLVYNYFALLNDLYIKNWVFTIFQPSDLERLFTITQYLERIKEYCGNCTNATVTTKTDGCGCK